MDCTTAQIALGLKVSDRVDSWAGPGPARTHSAAAGVLVWLCAAGIAVSGCAVSRRTAPGRGLGDYDYCVVGEKYAHRYADEATTILSRSFIVVQNDDPRLESPVIRRKACVLSLEWSRGFWSSAAYAELTDFDNHSMIQRSRIRRGMFWAGHHGDILDVLEDVAAARAAAGPPVPTDVEIPPAVTTKTLGARHSKADRLMELGDLRARGLISESEYSKQRAKILDEP
jgi:hypothetical protein